MSYRLVSQQHRGMFLTELMVGHISWFIKVNKYLFPQQLKNSLREDGKYGLPLKNMVINLLYRFCLGVLSNTQ